MQEQIDQFFAPDGTLISIPVKAAKKIAVLKEITRKLQPEPKSLKNDQLMRPFSS